MLTDCVTADLARHYDEQSRLRGRLAAAAAIVGPPPCPAISRGGWLAARIEVRGTEVLLDGQVVPLNVVAESRGAILCLLRHLLAAKGDWRTGRQLDDCEQAGPCTDHIGVRWDRVRRRLPDPLKALTEPHCPKGFRLLPSAWRE